MPVGVNYDILLASHLVPYFALDKEGRNPHLQDNLDDLDYNQFSETTLIDTNGYTGPSLPEIHSYDTEIEDVEKGVLEPGDAETLVEKGKKFYLIGGRPEICMSNSYASLVKAARAYNKEIDFDILTDYCFTGPGEGTLEDELTRDNPDTELLNGLLSSYNFEHTSLVSEDRTVENIDNYLRHTQRMYQIQKILNRENYNAQFITDADRFQNYGSDQIHFKLEGGKRPSGAIRGLEHHLRVNNIFERLDGFKSDYNLEIEDQNGCIEIELNYHEGDLELEAAESSHKLEEIRNLLSEKVEFKIKNQTEKAEELKKIRAHF